jgi:hypothetical protein
MPAMTAVKHGRLLLGCAVTRGLEARQHVAAGTLLVDAKETKAPSFL